MFVYQVIYWTWLKLEMDESKLEKNGLFLSSAMIYVALTDYHSRRTGWSGEEGPRAGGLPEMNGCPKGLCYVYYYIACLILWTSCSCSFMMGSMNMILWLMRKIYHIVQTVDRATNSIETHYAENLRFRLFFSGICEGPATTALTVFWPLRPSDKGKHQSRPFSPFLKCSMSI